MRPPEARTSTDAFHRPLAEFLFDFGQLDGNEFGNSLLLHGDAEQGIRLIHRRLAVGDDDELRLRREPFQIGGEAIDIGVVERRFDLVENTEGHGVGFEDGKQDGDRRQRLFAARKQGNFAELLARVFV